MIKFSNVKYQYQHQDFTFDLDVEQGSLVAVIGPSGAGKSTLLNLLAGFIAPLQGDISIQDQSILSQAPHQRPIAILFQDNNLFTHLTAYQNIGLGLHPGLRLAPQQKQLIQSISEQVEVDQLLTRLPDQLSGGQQQRVALARCFVQNKPILLLDEPFSALDPVLRVAMLKRVSTLAKQQNVTVLMVTHHLNDALTVASHFVYVDKGHAARVEEINALNRYHENQQLKDFLTAEINRP